MFSGCVGCSTASKRKAEPSAEWNKPMTRQIYVNLAVKDPKRSMEFFGRLGFEFNPKFTDEKAACMIVNESAYVMLLGEPFFQTFTKRPLCDTSSHTEGLFAIS